MAQSQISAVWRSNVWVWEILEKHFPNIGGDELELINQFKPLLIELICNIESDASEILTKHLFKNGEHQKN